MSLTLLALIFGFHLQNAFFSIPCHLHSKFRARWSSTYTKIGIPCTISYDYGDVSGFFSVDHVKVGEIIVKDQEFIEITREAFLPFLVAKYDGILGLGFPEISVEQATPLWFSMMQQGHINHKLFSLWLSGDLTSELGGEIVFGGLDWRHFRGGHTYVPVTRSGYWEIVVGDILVESISTGVCKFGCAAILDSGTPLIAGPTVCVCTVCLLINSRFSATDLYNSFSWLFSLLSPFKSH